MPGPWKMLSRYLLTENETKKVRYPGHSQVLSQPPEPDLVALLVDLVDPLLSPSPDPGSLSCTPLSLPCVCLVLPAMMEMQV